MIALTASNWIKFLLLGLLILLVTVIIQGDRSAKDGTYQKGLEEKNQELIETNKKEQNRIKKLEQENKKLQTTKAKPPTTTTVVNYSVGSCEQYRSEVSKYSWPIDTVLQIMKAESGCNPNAISSTDDHGLMQLHGIRIYDPVENIRYAYQYKYLAGGFSHWTVCTSGIVDCW